MLGGLTFQALKDLRCHWIGVFGTYVRCTPPHRFGLLHCILVVQFSSQLYAAQGSQVRFNP
jgi:hypothetical protein